MNNLNAYLSSKSRRQHIVSNNIKINLQRNRVNHNNSYGEKVHNHSNNNILSRSTDSRVPPFNKNEPIKSLPLDKSHENKKKKNNLQEVNRSLGQLYDFKKEVRNIIYHQGDKVYRKDDAIMETKYKSSKQPSSNSRLQQRSHSSLDALDGNQFGNRVDYKIEDIMKKRKQKTASFQNAYGLQNKLQLKLRYSQQKVIKTQTNSKQTEKQPMKKRSKSAHPDSKKKQQIMQSKTKQSRSYSQKKVTKSAKDITKTLRQTMSALPNIKIRSMFRTRKGVQNTNPHKVNQDRFYIKENAIMQNERLLNLYIVADGHGPYGHMVSQLIIQQLHKKFDINLSANRSIETSLERTYAEIQTILIKNIQFNADFSGSTLVTVVVTEKSKLICANVGDSRAIVARKLSKSSWEVIRLSNDHKPSLEEQRRRILKSGGRIEKVHDELGNSIGPDRVWLPNKQVQGLAMSRSMGDNISKPIGVTHIPEVLSHQLTKEDKFILIASDGVWEFLSNYQILSLLIPYYRQNRLEDACQALMKQAHRSWTIDDCSIVDDITFILIFLEAKEQNDVQKVEDQTKNMTKDDHTNEQNLDQERSQQRL